MIERISSEQEEKTSHAQALVCCYGDSVAANSELMEKAASSMEQDDMAAFVQVETLLCDRCLFDSVSRIYLLFNRFKIFYIYTNIGHDCIRVTLLMCNKWGRNDFLYSNLYVFPLFLSEFKGLDDKVSIPFI